jgi:hypothetical protein
MKIGINMRRNFSKGGFSKVEKRAKKTLTHFYLKGINGLKAIKLLSD